MGERLPWLTALCGGYGLRSSIERAIQARHEQLLDGDAGELLSVGREYAAAVHEFSRATMTWLLWIDNELKSEHASLKAGQ